MTTAVCVAVVHADNDPNLSACSYRNLVERRDSATKRDIRQHFYAGQGAVAAARLAGKLNGIGANLAAQYARSYVQGRRFSPVDNLNHDRIRVLQGINAEKPDPRPLVRFHGVKLALHCLQLPIADLRLSGGIVGQREGQDSNGAGCQRGQQSIVPIKPADSDSQRRADEVPSKILGALYIAAAISGFCGAPAPRRLSGASSE